MKIFVIVSHNKNYAMYNVQNAHAAIYIRKWYLIIGAQYTHKKCKKDKLQLFLIDAQLTAKFLMTFFINAKFAKLQKNLKIDTKTHFSCILGKNKHYCNFFWRILKKKMSVSTKAFWIFLVWGYSSKVIFSCHFFIFVTFSSLSNLW